MQKAKRAFDLISDTKRQELIGEIIGYFQSERGEEIGVIAAEEMLDFMLENLAADLYNKGVEDSLQFVKERFVNMETDLLALLKK